MNKKQDIIQKQTYNIEVFTNLLYLCRLIENKLIKYDKDNEFCRRTEMARDDQ